MSRTLCRLAVTAVSTAAVSLVALAPSPALAAGSMFFSKSSGTFASASWLEVGQLPPEANAEGNAHFGFLSVEQVSRGVGNAFGVVFDVECPDGGPYVLPDSGHGDPGVPSEGPCEVVGVREMEGRGMAFTMDRKFTTARLTGTLDVGSHGGPVLGRPPVSITWTGVGPLETFTDTSRYSNEFGTGSFRYTSTSRVGEVGAGSRIGPMVFDDEPAEFSESQLGSFRMMSRDRS